MTAPTAKRPSFSTLAGPARGLMTASARPANDFTFIPHNAAFPETAQFAIPLPQDRILAEEVNLGLIREMVPPENHIGLQLVPFMDVPTNDVVFDYLRGAGTGLAPARAEDAESKLRQEDEFVGGQGRASVIDWAHKDHYTASDVSGYRGFKEIEDQVRQTGSFPFYVRSMVDGFAARVARHTADRRRKLDNRIEWLIMTALSTGGIVYDDGEVSFAVDFGRPLNQQAQTFASGTYAGTDHDPINDILAIKQLMLDRYGVEIDRAVCSRKFLNSLFRSSKFIPLTGFLPSQGIDASDLPYLSPGFGPSAAVAVIERETGIKFIEYDSVYRQKVPGQPVVNAHRFTPENRVIFLPNEQQVAEYNNTDLGFGKVLTSPHPMGNWTPGFYAWEQETTDPWGHEVGTGIQALPVFPVMETTYTVDVQL